MPQQSSVIEKTVTAWELIAIEEAIGGVGEDPRDPAVEQDPVDPGPCDDELRFVVDWA